MTHTRKKVDARAREDERKTESGTDVNNHTDITPSAPRHFSPPTLLELSSFCVEHDLHVDVQRFAEYYRQNDWKTKTGRPVTDWKQKLIDWDKADEPNRIEEEKRMERVERGRREQEEREAKLEEEFRREFEKRKNAILKPV